jgi:hypothetical protein
MKVQTTEEIRAYLLARVDQVPGGCWIWKLGLDRRGYGLCYLNGRNQRAARVAFEVWVGPIPPGHDLHHTCPNRACINPAHVEPMPHGIHLRLHAASGAWAGEKNSQAKISDADAQFIKVAAGFLPARDLAVQFGVSERTIYHIKSGGGWPHVSLPVFPQRSREEVLRDGQAAMQKALNVMLKVQADRRERGQPQPPKIDLYITLARACAGL